MGKKENHVVHAELDDLLFVFGSALRYGLGRKSYAVGLISRFVKDNRSMLNEKWLINLLEDIKSYEEDKVRGWIHDDDCDYSDWMSLKATLRDEYISRNFEHDLFYHGLDYESPNTLE